jgi:hypothetical protein
MARTGRTAAVHVGLPLAWVTTEVAEVTPAASDAMQPTLMAGTGALSRDAAIDSANEGGGT